MKILILGGTGCMGVALIDVLGKQDHEIYVTSRKTQPDLAGIHWLLGDAHDNNFIKKVVLQKFDVIIDFMLYGYEEFQEKINMYLENTGHYIFLSSARVYADSYMPLTEESPLLLESSQDQDFLRTSEYSLEKAREEKFLRFEKRRNWNIIRPYITYNFNRLQLGVYEKEYWLYRVLKGKTVLFPKEMLRCTTTMTYAEDVAQRIALLLGNGETMGKIILPITSESHTWEEVIDIYKNVLCDIVGIKQINIQLMDSYQFIDQFFHNKYQIIYDRLYHRHFDNTCTEKILLESGRKKGVCLPEYTALELGIRKSIERFIKSGPHFGEINSQWDEVCDGIINTKIAQLTGAC